MVGYLRRLHDYTSVAAAKQIALREFPGDAVITDYKVLDICALMVVQSKTVGAALAASGFGDPQGFAMVGVYTGLADGSQAYQPGNINELSLGPNDRGNVKDGDRC